jgi:hypothetical protein
VVSLGAVYLISISVAAQATPYSAEYLSLLARKGKLKAVKIKNAFMTLLPLIFL